MRNRAPVVPDVRANQELIDALAERIERAYGLRRRDWNPGCSTTRVWAVAASALVEAHRADPDLPLDPELFVASQLFEGALADPWSELTRLSSIRRFRQLVRQIIETLEHELAGEVRRAERLIGRGAAIETVVLEERGSLSPLGRFITARRARRDDLAEELSERAADQHQSCPLYRAASLRLIPPEQYPVTTAPSLCTLPAPRTPKPHALRN